MTDLSQLFVHAQDPSTVIRAMTDLYPLIEHSDRRRLSRVMASYFTKLGEEGLWLMVNGKSFEEILSSFKGDSIRVEAEGRVGNMTYTLLSEAEADG